MKAGWKKLARSEKDLGRKPGKRSTRKLFLIVCEDKKAAPGYFEWLRQDLRLSTTEVKICGKECGSAPRNVVEFALKHKKNSRQNFDYVYCILDVDQHATLKEAIAQAERNSFDVLLSSPCFEIWYLLHYVPGGRNYLNCDQLIAELRQHIPNYEKGAMAHFPTLKEHLDRAIQNAKRLIDLREENRFRNPSTEVFRLIEALRANAPRI